MDNYRRFGWLLAWALLGATACGDDSGGNTSDDASIGDGDGDSAGDGDGDGDSAGDGDGDGDGTPKDPATAPRAEIDRFSAEAGHLMVRDDTNGLPAANEAVDFDVAPFITTGLGPDGNVVRYYNFDIMPTTSAPIFALFRDGEDMPVEGQLNVIDVIPGDADYNDFWHVHKVTVPADYVANTLTSVDAIMDSGYPIERTTLLVNCPVVPEGSTATMRYGGGDTGLTMGWYKDEVVTYFEFGEAALQAVLPDEGHPEVPLSPIYVAFNINPGEDGGGPPSGFVMEAGSDQTHNVVATDPDDADYSPFWMVNIYDNADFDAVTDLASAQAANVLAPGAANVNCPIVDVQ